METDFSARIISLPEAYEIAYKISQQITDTSESYDIIIGISRGGLPPARMMCDFLNIATLTSLQIRHYKSGGEEIDDVEVTDPVDIDLKGKNLLIVDDVNDSGKTLRAAYEHVLHLKPALIKTAVLHEKKNTSFKANYTGSDLFEWKWLIYQWAVTEDLLEFLNKDNMLQVSEEKAVSHLAKKYKLKIDKDLFQKVIKMKENYF